MKKVISLILTLCLIMSVVVFAPKTSVQATSATENLYWKRIKTINFTEEEETAGVFKLYDSSGTVADEDVKDELALVSFPTSENGGGIRIEKRKAVTSLQLSVPDISGTTGNIVKVGVRYKSNSDAGVFNFYTQKSTDSILTTAFVNGGTMRYGARGSYMNRIIYDHTFDGGASEEIRDIAFIYNLTDKTYTPVLNGKEMAEAYNGDPYAVARPTGNRMLIQIPYTAEGEGTYVQFLELYVEEGFDSAEECITLDYEKLEIYPDNPEITGHLTLPTMGEYGSIIKWTSSRPDIIGDDGRFVQIPYRNTEIKLTATLINGVYVREKVFRLIVRGQPVSGGGGSGGSGGGGGCAVKGVSLNKTSTTLSVGETETLLATIIPTNETNIDVYWKSSNTDVATVLDGVVMAKAVGTTTITVTTIDGGYTANCVVNVAEKVIDEGTPKITISNVSATPGREIEVTVDLSNNTGFANLGIEIGYNSDIMTLTKVISNPAVGGVFTPAPKYTVNPFNMAWNSVANITYNGNLATLTFVVNEDAPDGIYPVTVDYYKGVNGNYIDGENINYDENFEAVGFEYTSGDVMVIAPKIAVTGTRTLPGKEIEVTIDLAENKGFANLGIEVGYDTNIMTLTKVVSNSGVGGTFTPAQNYTANPFNMSWDSITDIKYNGNLATLTFTVKEDAPGGVYPITVDFYKGVRGDYVDGESVNYDENFNAVGFDYVSGNVIVRNYTPGDISGDEFVDSKDATLLLRYIAGWSGLDIVEDALDIDGSGKVDNKDATILLRYLAGWNVKLY